MKILVLEKNWMSEWVFNIYLQIPKNKVYKGIRAKELCVLSNQSFESSFQ